VTLAVLYTTGTEVDWPDHLDIHTGDFLYSGDTRHAGTELHVTQRRGNLLLSKVFAWSLDSVQRKAVPPFFLFDKPGPGRAVRFRGLLAPGSPRLASHDELTAVWRSTGGTRFQNYRAHFTVLDVPVISRDWLTELQSGNSLGTHCPPPWRQWVTSRSYQPLTAPPTHVVRTPAQQLPGTDGMAILELIHKHFSENPTQFEHFAADLWKATEPHVERIDVTRPWRDGGRDAVGDYLIGPPADPVAVEFALEAKCYNPGVNRVGVKDTSRLISRLRHRQFGVLITTSVVDKQAYQEIREDGHPVVIIAGIDLVARLGMQGLQTQQQVAAYLQVNYASGASTTEV
jgi:hypothetical protein